MHRLEFSKRTPLRIWAKQGDSGRELEFQCISDSLAMNLTGCTVTLNMVKPIKVFANAVITNAVEGKIKVNLSNDILSQRGIFPADISVFNSSGKVISSANFDLDVDVSQRDEGAAEASEDMSALKVALGKVNNLETQYAPRLNSVESSLEQKASQTALEIEKNRINNLVANTGNTSGNSEIIDIRVGADGKTYPTAAEAVREQVNKLSKGIDIEVDAINKYKCDFITKSKNIFNKETLNVGYQYTEASGAIVANANLSVSDYIEVSSGAKYSYAGSLRGVAFYDKNFQFLGFKNIITQTGIHALTNPFITLDGAKYIRIQFYSAENIATIGLSPGLTAEVGEYIKPYFNEAVKLKNKSVYKRNTSLIDKSANLFNKNDILTNTVLRDSGLVETLPSYYLSGFIEVEPETVYSSLQYAESSGGFKWVGYYNSSKEFIIRKDELTSKNNFVTPRNCFYIRLLGMNNVTLDNVMLVEGKSYPTTYIPFAESINIDITKSDIGKTENLFNKFTITKKKSISADGSIVNNDAYTISDFIEVDSNAEYTVTGNPIDGYGLLYVAMYTKNKIFLKRINLEELNTHTFTTTILTKYIRVTGMMHLQDIERVMVVKGTSLPDRLIPYLPVIDGKPVKAINTFEDKNIMFCPNYPAVHDVYSNSQTIPFSNVINNLKCADIYALYDALMAKYPNYITRTNLGTANSTNIYMYTFKPLNDMPTQQEHKHKHPKCILVSGVHGEYVGIFNLFKTLENIYDNQYVDKILYDLRNNVQYLVIPCLNPYAIDNGGRVNENGVNISRNMSAEWAYIAANADKMISDYSGTAPLTEVSSQVLDKVMRQNNDAFLFSSCHNFYTGGYQASFWSMSKNYKTSALGTMLNKNINYIWRKKQYVPISSDYFGYIEHSAPTGSEATQALKYGLHGGTFEVCRGFNASESNYDTVETINNYIELLTNWIYISYMYKNS